MEKGLIYSTDQEFTIKLIIVEWARNLYWNFEWGATIKTVKWERLVGSCIENVGWDWYCEFGKLKYEYQHDIVKTLIEIKKSENLFDTYDYEEEDYD